MQVKFRPRLWNAVCSACLAAALMLSACAPAQTQSLSIPTQTAEPTMSMPAPTTDSTPAAAQPTLSADGPRVTISNFTFSPNTLTVPVGTTVTWINEDDTVHTVTSTDKLFASAALDTGNPFSFKFNKAGTYSYFCSLHPMMVGKIIVQ